MTAPVQAAPVAASNLPEGWGIAPLAMINDLYDACERAVHKGYAWDGLDEIIQRIDDAYPAPVAAPVAQGDAHGWISVDERLPEVGQTVLTFAPNRDFDHPDEVRISFDCIDPNDDDHASWLNHNEHYEHFCCVAKPEGSTGPSERAPYTYWKPLPPAPGEATPADDRLTALQAQVDLLSASLKQSDAVRDQLVAALKDAHPYVDHAGTRIAIGAALAAGGAA